LVAIGSAEEHEAADQERTDGVTQSYGGQGVAQQVDRRVQEKEVAGARSHAQGQRV